MPQKVGMSRRMSLMLVFNSKCLDSNTTSADQGCMRNNVEAVHIIMSVKFNYKMIYHGIFSAIHLQ